MNSPVSRAIPKRAVHHVRGHILGGLSPERRFNIMDRCRAVHCHRGDELPLHQVDDDRGKSDLHDMCAHHQDHRLAFLFRPHDVADQTTEIARNEDIRQTVHERAEGIPLPVERHSELLRGDLALPRPDGNGLDLRKVSPGMSCHDAS